VGIWLHRRVTMRKGATGCLVFVLAVMASVGASGQFSLWVDCPKCNYKFDGPVPPPMVGGVATGSGFVIHPDGYILTNYHVIEGSSSIQVKVGGKEYSANVVESLPAQDLALLKIEAHGLPVVALGNADSLQVGDDVFAIGCPGGVCGTVTAGRVANTGVTITVEDGKQLQGMLMVDITTDHGSSGGPLVNSRGEVVGITTAGQQGSFGFSIPINQAIPLLRRVPGFDVSQTRWVERPRNYRFGRSGIG
jgi:serine protease Do